MALFRVEAGMTGMKRWIIFMGAALAATANAVAATKHEAGEWTTAGPPVPYADTDDIQVDTGATLTIDPGVTVHMGGGRSLFVNGTLVVNGTASQPVAFTASNAASPWGNVQFAGGSTGTVQHAAVTYATGTYAAVQVGAANVTIAGSTFANDGRYGVSIDSVAGSASHAIVIQSSTFHSNGGVNVLSARSDDALRIQGNDFSGISTGSAVRVVAGALAAFSPSADVFSGNAPSNTFDILSSSTFLKDVTLWHTLNVLSGNGDLTVAAGKTLTVVAGASIRFQAGQGLHVSGTLVSNGTAAAPVAFTSAGATPGAWDGIALQPGGTATLNNTGIFYGGGDGGSGLSSDGGTATLNAVEIAYSATEGVRFLDSDASNHALSVQNSSLHDNGSYGVSIESINAGDTALVANSTFAGNAGTIGVFAASLPVFNAGPAQVAGNTPSDVLAITSGGAADRILPNGLTLWEQVADGYSLSVPAGAAATLEGGAALHMSGQSSVDVMGTLNALGRTPNGNGGYGPVVTFDGGGASPAGTWGGVLFHPGAHGSMTGVVLRDGGANGAMVSVEGAAVTLAQCALVNGAGAGIMLSGTPTFTMKSSLVTGQAGPGIRDLSTGGARVAGNTPANGCDIFNNGTAAGADNQFEATAAVDTLAAEYNYWGDPAGPYNPTLNSDGSLNHQVSDHVDFQNFVTSPQTAPAARLDNVGSLAAGTVPIFGEAYSPLLDSWTLEYGAGDAPTSYMLIATGSNNVLSGKLADWNTTGLNHRIRYTLRLTVRDVLGRTSVAITVTRTPFGDVNGNGFVDLADAEMALRFALGQSVPVGGQLAAADVRPAPTPDGVITLDDAAAILQTVGGLHGKLP